MNNPLLLSIFPGIDLLGRAFEEIGFCVVRGPDLITGGDIRTFHPPNNAFSGVIGCPPCQDFSRLNRNPGDYGTEMIRQYCRVVEEAGPDWFLFENVIAAPDFVVPGYEQQRFALDLAWFSDFSRRRDFVFGSKCGQLLDPINDTRGSIEGTCVTGSDDRSFPACCEIQGLPSDFDVPCFSLEGKKQAVANGVPLALGRYVAGLIAATAYGHDVTEDTPGASRFFAPEGHRLRPPGVTSQRRCGCGCGRVVVGRAKYQSATCRKRAQRARDAA